MAVRLVKMKTSHKRWRSKVWPTSHLHIGLMLPNIVTISALCMGLTAIHFAFLQHWQHAVASVLIAGILDGIDGRLARFLGSSTEFGAELDSLADFINFGVAPALILYFFSGHLLGGLGWGICLFFTSCMALRLARFNVQRSGTHSPVFSVGVPAPAGALLAFLPIIISFSWDSLSVSPIYFVLSMGCSGLLMISRYPTFIFKKMSLKQDHIGLFLLSMIVLISGLLTAPWAALFVICVLYVLSLPFSGYMFYALSRKKDEKKLS
jgi:CDP-diacylglycerol--serine O-phosphatidyltransferase